MYPKFKEISLDTATWTVAFLGAIEERETKSKKPFCTFHLLDGAIAIIANLWNTEKKDIYKVQEKSVISVQLYKKLYNGVETYEVKEYQAAPDDAKLEDYLLTAPIPSQDMMDEIKSILSKEISETELYPLVMEILDENADKLLYWAAAKTIHHNCYGGLLYHMLRMLKTAVILSRVYRFDKELLYSAVILHDIGKLQELDTDATGVAEYTVDGNLFGHTLLAIGVFEISRGTVAASLLSAREILIRILIVGATHFLICHNHPSGHLQPSKYDVDSTKNIVNAGRTIGIPLVDHLIIGDGRYVSLLEEYGKELFG